jgi:hypothetical protein
MMNIFFVFLELDKGPVNAMIDFMAFSERLGFGPFWSAVWIDIFI